MGLERDRKGKFEMNRALILTILFCAIGVICIIGTVSADVFYINSSVINDANPTYVISQPGTYVFDSDIIDIKGDYELRDFYDTNPVILILCDNVVIDGQGHTLDMKFPENYQDPEFTDWGFTRVAGIGLGECTWDAINNEVVVRNINIKNLHISDFSYGIVGNAVEDVVITNNTFTDIFYDVFTTWSQVNNVTLSQNYVDSCHGNGFGVSFYYQIDDMGINYPKYAKIVDNIFTNLPSVNTGNYACYVTGYYDEVMIKNNTMTGSNPTTAQGMGISVDSIETVNPTSMVIIEDNIIENLGTGISSYQVATTIKNNTLSNNHIGIKFIHVWGTTVTRNQIENSIDYGIAPFDAVECQIYDNYFNNTENIMEYYRTYINEWNESIPGINIVGGPSIGGNYWGRPDGSGFSDTAVDLNGDGFADETFAIYTDNFDYLPLVKYENNEPPTLEDLNDITINVNQNLEFTLIASDPDGDSLTYSFTGFPADATLTGPTFSWTPTQAGTYTVNFMVSDGSLFDSEEITITVVAIPTDKTAPVVSTVTATPNPVPLNTAVTLTATIDDLGTGNSNIISVKYSIDGSAGISMTPTDGAFNSPLENVTVTIPAYTLAGVHSISVNATDATGNYCLSDAILLAVYDPSGGFVTGGGWIISPAGAYVMDPALTGKATFGFVSKYEKGAKVPTGQTEFQFNAGNLNFKSTVYDWLVVAGAKAQYKGSGTINGAGDYGFMLTATDGAVNGGGGTDKFRLKIWEKASGAVVYDNQMNAPDTSDPTTVIGAGSIVVHVK